MYQAFPDRFAFSDDDTAEKGVAYHLALGQTPELHASLDEPLRWQPRSFEKSYSPDDFYGGTLKGIGDQHDRHPCALHADGDALRWTAPALWKEQDE